MSSFLILIAWVGFYSLDVPGFQNTRNIRSTDPDAATNERRRKFDTQKLTLANGNIIRLSLPVGFGISVAAEGLRRVRFMAKSPDNRIFVTDMNNLADNARGAVYILDGFESETKKFTKVTAYLKRLRNPNSIAFYTDAGGVHWLYLALTDRLVRYKYEAGDEMPSSEPEVLATFPDYGLGYKYGGWHLTRTIAVGSNGKIYVSVGSSCNACQEKERVRASILEMDPDGKNQKLFATGLRNAVGIRWVDGRLIATNMGVDHLGDHRPADTMYDVDRGKNYGWPYCYQSGPKVLPDPRFNPRGKKFNCRNVSPAIAAFDSHSSPLGLEFFSKDDNAGLSNTFLVALHGSTKKSLDHGYRVVNVSGSAPSDTPADFITGFLRAGKVYGRPVDILALGRGSFLLTDDFAGVVYYVFRK